MSIEKPTFEQPKKPERGVEQDRLAFVEAARNIEIGEIETEFDEKSVENLTSELDASKLLILGEMHGVKENADIIYTLFKKFGFKKLALEWDTELQAKAQIFLETGELDFDAIKDSPDGRITAGHFALFKKLKDEGLLEALVFFDGKTQSGEWDERDANMAENILANLSDSKTLAVAGNLHAQTEPIVFDETEHHPMGENVKKQIPAVPSGKIKYLTGQYHNYGVKDFREKPEGVDLPKAKFYKSDEGIYVFELPEAHAAAVPNPKEVLPDVSEEQSAETLESIKKSKYELADAKHELVSKYQPKFLAKGGEHIIYELPEHPDVVVKVRTASLKKVLEWNTEHGQPLDSLPDEIEPRAREYLKEEAERYQQLKKYFGSDHVPSQKEFLLKVPITENILREIYEGNPPAITSQVWSIVMVQKRVDALNDPSRLAIVAGYAEQSEVPEDIYKQATEHFIFSKNPGQKMEKEQFLQVQSHNDLRNLLEKAEGDENLKKDLKDLVERMVAYTQETGEIFDLAGQDNIILFQKDGKWSFSLVDTRYPGESKMIEKARAALSKLSEGNELDEHEKNILLNTFNFVRTVNGLAEQVGVEKRINIVPEGMTQRDIDFLSMLR